MTRGTVAAGGVATMLALFGCGDSGSGTTTPAEETDGKSDPRPALTVQTARDLVREHYRQVNQRDFDDAFSNFSPDARAQFGPKAHFVRGYDDTLRTSVHDVAIVSRTGHEQVVVAFALSAAAEDECGDRIDQEYEGTWTVENRSSGLALDDSEIEQLAGEELVSTGADCPPPEPPPPPPPPEPPEPPPPPPSSDCAPGYDPCLDPNSYDYDCASGSGDGPDYISGPVSVSGSDPFDLDSDYDGVGCE